ncbi:MAG TPA: hypothetical protein VGP84_01025, partial [Gemmatimonadaceae bacterium]|nr:hypothetical protein [Gemmatimonadaceae bacterium]
MMHRIPRCAALIAAGIASACSARDKSPGLAGDWDAYVADGSTARAGFEGWRRMGFAHFAGSDSGFVGSIRRRTGEAMIAVMRVAGTDSVLLSGDGNQSLKATWSGDTLTGVALASGQPAGRRIRLVRRATPFVVEKQFPLWPGAVSDSQYAVTEDTAVFMTTRDGARLVSYIARPVGNGPFGVVM